MQEVAINSKYSLESERELRDKLRALKQPCYSKIINMLYISIPIIGGNNISDNWDQMWHYSFTIRKTKYEYCAICMSSRTLTYKLNLW